MRRIATVSLWYLVFAGFACNYMIRINLNIAIVDMTKVKSKGRAILMCGNSSTTNGSIAANDNDLFLERVILFRHNKFFWLLTHEQKTLGYGSHKEFKKTIFFF